MIRFIPVGATTVKSCSARYTVQVNQNVFMVSSEVKSKYFLCCVQSQGQLNNANKEVCRTS